MPNEFPLYTMQASSTFSCISVSIYNACLIRTREHNPRYVSVPPRESSLYGISEINIHNTLTGYNSRFFFQVQCIGIEEIRVVHELQRILPIMRADKACHRCSCIHNSSPESAVHLFLVWLHQRGSLVHA